MINEIENLQVFVTTHNRANYLKESLESLISQSVKFEIIVLDNESADNTEYVAKSYENFGVKYIKTYGFLGNYKKAKELANKEFLMLFHDDDILHPTYIENSFKLINKHENISLVTTRYFEFKDTVEIESEYNKRASSLEYYLFKSQKDFARHMYFVERIGYASAIYKTEYFLKEDLEYDKYNKFNDWPFMAKFAKHGNVILIDGNNTLFTRRHQYQDTWTFTNSPNIEQIVNWNDFFGNVMCINEYKDLEFLYNIKSAYFNFGKYEAFCDKDLYKIEDIGTGNMILDKDLIIEDKHRLLFCYVKQLLSENKYNIKFDGAP